MIQANNTPEQDMVNAVAQLRHQMGYILGNVTDFYSQGGHNEHVDHTATVEIDRTEKKPLACVRLTCGNEGEIEFCSDRKMRHDGRVIKAKDDKVTIIAQAGFKNGQDHFNTGGRIIGALYVNLKAVSKEVSDPVLESLFNRGLAEEIVVALHDSTLTITGNFDDDLPRESITLDGNNVLTITDASIVTHDPSTGSERHIAYKDMSYAEFLSSTKPIAQQ